MGVYVDNAQVLFVKPPSDQVSLRYITFWNNAHFLIVAVVSVISTYLCDTMFDLGIFFQVVRRDNIKV
jgi:hypothetical protein